MAATDAVGEAPTTISAEVSTPAHPLGAPFTPWRFFLLVAASAGLYLFFWMYRIGRDAEAVTGKPRSEWMYPVSMIFLPFAAVLVARTVRECDEVRAARTGTTRKRWRPALCGWLFVFGVVMGAVPWPTTLYIALAILVCALAMLPAESAINAARLGAPLAHKPTVGGFARWQYVLLVVGAVLWALFAFVIYQYEWTRFVGERLDADRAALVMDKRYAVTPAQSGWSRVATTDDPDLEDYLVGSYEQEALFYFYEDYSLGALVQDRRTTIGEANDAPPECRETRTFDDSNGNVEVRLDCRTRDALGTHSLYTMKAIDDGKNVAEILILATVERQLVGIVTKDAAALADSFEPAP